jgi:hypothetical protein
MAQSDDGIDAHGSTPRGNVGSRQSHSNERYRYTQKRSRIVSAYAEEQTREKLGYLDGRGYSARLQDNARDFIQPLTVELH